MGFYGFLTIGIFSGFSENPRDSWQIPGIRDFRSLGIFIPGIRNFLSLGILIPGIRDFPYFRDFYPRDFRKIPVIYVKSPGSVIFHLWDIPGIGIFFRGMGYPNKKPPLLSKLFLVYSKMDVIQQYLGQVSQNSLNSPRSLQKIIELPPRWAITRFTLIVAPSLSRIFTFETF